MLLLPLPECWDHNFYTAGDGTQGIIHTRQAFYQLSYIPQPQKILIYLPLAFYELWKNEKDLKVEQLLKTDYLHLMVKSALRFIQKDLKQEREERRGPEVPREGLRS